MRSSFVLSRPYASEAAVGSLMIRLTSRPESLPASRVAWRWASLKYAGTVITASVTVSPRYDSASDLSFCRIIALISGGLYCLPPASTQASPLAARTTLKGTRRRARSTSGSSYLRPIKRLIEKTVFSAFVMACRLATSPTSRSPLLVKATTDGVVRAPSAFGMTTGSPPSITATQLLVVPRSMPMTLPTLGASSTYIPFHGANWMVFKNTVLRIRLWLRPRWRGSTPCRRLSPAGIALLLRECRRFWFWRRNRSIRRHRRSRLRRSAARPRELHARRTQHQPVKLVSLLHDGGHAAGGTPSGLHLPARFMLRRVQRPAGLRPDGPHRVVLPRRPQPHNDARRPDPH